MHCIKFPSQLIWLTLAILTLNSKVYSQQLSVSISQKYDAQCFNTSTGSAIVSVKSGVAPYMYNWNTAPAQINDTALNLGAGNYTVKVTDVTGATDFAMVTINQPKKLTATAITKDIDCFGKCDGTATAVALGGNGPYRYNWENVEDQITGIAKNLCAGIYKCTIIDGNLCTVKITTTIKQQPAMLLSYSSVPAACNYKNGSARVTISGGAAGYKIIWNTVPAQTKTIAKGLAIGNYNIIVTDKNGCTKSETVAIKGTSAPTLTITKIQHNKCFGDKNGLAELEVTGGTPPYLFTWSNGLIGPKQIGLKAGNYTCTVSDSNKCTASIVVTITEPAQLKLVTQVHGTSCGGNNGSASVTISGGSGNYGLAWNTVPVQTTNAANNLAPGTYAVTVKDGNGCTKLAKVVVKASEGPKPFIVAVVNNNCNGAKEGAVTINANGGKPPYKFIWNNNITGAKLSNLTAGNYTCTVIDSSSCFSVISVSITEPDATVLKTSVVPTNCSGNNGTGTVTVTGGSGGYTFSWSTNPLQTAATAVGLVPGVYNVLVKDVYGCSKSAAVTIVNSGQLNLVVITKNSSCKARCDGSAKGTVTNATSPYAIEWLPAKISGKVIDNLCAGTYTCTAIDTTGCKGSTIFNISEPSLLTVATTTETIADCNIKPVTLKPLVNGGTKPYTYLWSNTAITDSIIVNTINTASYELIVKDANGCTTTGVLNVIVNKGNNNVEGTVYYTNGTENYILKSGTVNLYSADSAGVMQPVSKGIITNGTYKIANVARGSYKLLALPDKKLYPYLTNTYYIKAYGWDSAYAKTLTCETTFRADVQMDSIASPKGNASISGRLLPDKKILDNKSIIKGVDVNLVEYIGNKIVASTFTDSIGAYAFTAVSPPKPGARYYIFINKPGYKQLSTYSCIPNNSDKLINKNYLIGKSTIYFDVHSGSTDDLQLLEFIAYPNPYVGTTTINYSLKETAPINLSIYNLLGQQVQIMENAIKSAGSYALPFSTKNLHLPAGVYIAKLIVNNNVAVIRLIEME